MQTLSIDIETYSDVNLSKCGVYKYAESPDFEILLFGYSADGSEVTVIDLAQGERLPQEIIDALTDDTVVKWAFNANFERVCLSRYLRDLGVSLDPFHDNHPISTEGYLLNIKGLEQDIEELKERQSSEHSLREVNDPGIQVIDTYYYQVEGVRMKERLLIFAADYQHLDQTGKLFYLHKDKYKANCCILKKYDSILHAKVPRNKIYTLKKGLRSIYINNYEYHLMCYENCPPPPPEPEPEDFGAKYKSVAEALDRVEKDWSGLLDAETEYYEKHLFLSERQRASMRRMLRHQKNTIDRYKNDLNEMADAYRKENQEYKVERSEDDLFSGTER